MTKLLEKAIAYLQRLEPAVQDELAQNILEDSLLELSDAERSDIATKVAEAEADFRSGRFTENDETFWSARLAHASRANTA